MAFADSIALNNNAAVAKSFTRKYSKENESQWIEASSTPSDQTLMKISHSKVGAGAAPGSTVDRHLVQAQRSKLNATLGKVEVITVNVTITSPSSSSLTTTDLYDAVAYVKNFLTTTNVDKLMLNQT